VKIVIVDVNIRLLRVHGLGPDLLCTAFINRYNIDTRTPSYTPPITESESPAHLFTLFTWFQRPTRAMDFLQPPPQTKVIQVESGKANQHNWRVKYHWVAIYSRQILLTSQSKYIISNKLLSSEVTCGRLYYMDLTPYLVSTLFI